MLYSINDLEKLTGIKSHTIRMWEKRYHILNPERTSTNIRYYHDNDLKKLLNISTLNRHGFKISHIARMGDEEIQAKIMEITHTGSDEESQIENLVIGMLDLNEQTFDKNLHRAILKKGFETTVTRIIYPFLEKVGVLWQIGTINPAHEHFITNLIRQKLIIAIDGLSGVSKFNGKTFLLFLPEHEMHEIGLLFYQYILKKNGFHVLYLGQSVPFRDLLEIPDTHQINYLLTYFVAAMNPEEISQYIRKLSDSFPDKTIFVTGKQIQDTSISLPRNVISIKDTETFRQMLDKL
ncbi:MAG: MerR family transcriptional regulator [Bacteroidales bacterium]